LLFGGTTGDHNVALGAYGSRSAGISSTSSKRCEAITIALTSPTRSAVRASRTTGTTGNRYGSSRREWLRSDAYPLQSGGVTRFRQGESTALALMDAASPLALPGEITAALRACVCTRARRAAVAAK